MRTYVNTVAERSRRVSTFDELIKFSRSTLFTQRDDWREWQPKSYLRRCESLKNVCLCELDVSMYIITTYFLTLSRESLRITMIHYDLSNRTGCIY